MPQESEKLEQWLRELNQGWLDQNFEHLGDWYHPDAILFAPGGTTIQGREAIVQGYREFCEMSTLHSFEMLSFQFYSLEGVEVCHMAFRVDYEIPTGRFQEEGLEVYIIGQSQEKPKILWRTQTTLKTVEVPVTDSNERS